MPVRNHFSGANGNPQKRSSTFSIKLLRSTGPIATQFQSDLELLARYYAHIENCAIVACLKLTSLRQTRRGSTRPTPNLGREQQARRK
jgi:hypothetical protein